MTGKKVIIYMQQKIAQGEILLIIASKDWTDFSHVS